MRRTQIEQRLQITQEDRIKIKAKSNGNCCHCGKYLGMDYTIEHVIPISKGGTNDFGNLVGLCKKCNKEKSNDVIKPADYYSYLNGIYMDELEYNQAKYYEEFTWLSKKNLFPEDKIKVKVPISENIDIKRVIKNKKNKSAANLYISYYLYKANYSDLDDVYYFVQKYNKKYLKCDFEAESLKEMITDTYENGAFYIVRNKSNEIKLVMPISIENGHALSSRKAFFINNIMVSKNDYHAMCLAVRVVEVFFSEISKHYKSPVNKHFFYMFGHKGDAISGAITQELYKFFGISRVNDSEGGIYIRCCCKKFEGFISEEQEAWTSSMVSGYVLEDIIGDTKEEKKENFNKLVDEDSEIYEKFLNEIMEKSVED